MNDYSSNIDGILIKAGENNRIVCNLVYCSWASETKFKTCYRIHESFDNNIACNYALYGGVGFQFEGYCGQTTAFGSNMMFYNFSRGLYLDNTGVIGPQIDMGNMFYSNSGYIAAEASLGYYSLSIFKANPSWPYNWPTISYPPGWFVISGNSPLDGCLPNNCIGRLVELDSIFFSENEKILAGSNLDSIFTFNQKIAFDRNLLTKSYLAEESELAPSILEYKELPQNQTVNEFIKTDFDLTQLKSIDETTENIISGLRDSIFNVMNLLNQNNLLFHGLSSPIFKDSIKNVNSQFLQTIRNVKDQLLTIMDSQNVDKENLFAEIVNRNTNLSTSDLNEENEKVINSIYLNFIHSNSQGFVWTQSINEISRIANICVEEGGRSRYKAKMLLQLYQMNQIIIDTVDVSCTSSTQRIGRSITQGSSTSHGNEIIYLQGSMFSNEIKIFANNLESNNVYLDIYDVQGRLVEILNISLKNGQNTSQISLSSGSYIYSISTINGNNYRGKFILLN